MGLSPLPCPILSLLLLASKQSCLFRGCSNQLALGTFPRYKYGQREPPLQLGAKVGWGGRNGWGSGGPASRNKAAAPWGRCVSSGSLLQRFLVSNHTFHASRGCLEEQARRGLRGDCECSRGRETESEPGRWRAASTEAPQHAEVNIRAPPTYFVCGLLAHLPIQGVSWSFPRETTITFEVFGRSPATGARAGSPARALGSSSDAARVGAWNTWNIDASIVLASPEVGWGCWRMRGRILILAGSGDLGSTSHSLRLALSPSWAPLLHSVLVLFVIVMTTLLLEGCVCVRVCAHASGVPIPCPCDWRWGWEGTLGLAA